MESRAWFGRPVVSVRDVLRGTDMTIQELGSYWSGASPIDIDATLHPHCISWPMGFAWSSFLAQSSLLAQCFAGGLKRNQVLSDDHLSP